jgi:adenylate kinase family enzyme
VHSFRKDNGNKLSSELLSEAFRWRLEQTDCQNRGYILDGYPKSFKQAQEVFEVTPEKPAKKMIRDPEAEEDDENAAMIPEPSVEPSLNEDGEPKPDKWAMQFQKHIYPNSVIYLRGDDQTIIRAQEEKATAEQDKAAAEGKKFDMDINRISERIELYKTNNDLNLFAKANTEEKLGRSDCPVLQYPMTRFF